MFYFIQKWLRTDIPGSRDADASKNISTCADKCFIPELVLLLEKAPLSNNIFVVVTGIFVMIVEIDKRIMFHDVLAMEYLMKNKKYSNIDYITRTFLTMVFLILGLFVCGFQSVVSTQV